MITAAVTISRDVIAVVDGRPELVREVAEAPDDVRTYIATEAGKLLGTRAFVDALPGFLLPDSAPGPGAVTAGTSEDPRAVSSMIRRHHLSALSVAAWD